MSSKTSKCNIQAGDTGSRVHSLTMSVGKQLLEVVMFIQIIDRCGLKVSRPEEIVYKSAYIDDTWVREPTMNLKHKQYGRYLFKKPEDAAFR